jgi:hypothetical protein
MKKNSYNVDYDLIIFIIKAELQTRKQANYNTK